MMLQFVTIVIPTVLYVALIALPKGKPAALGWALSFVCILFAWAAFMLGLWPFSLTAKNSSGFMVLADSLIVFLGLFVGSVTIIIVGVLQLVRSKLLTNSPIWVWPVLVLVAFAITALILFLVGENL